MLRTLITLLFFHFQISHALSLQIGSVLPWFIKGSPSGNLSDGGYNDQKIHPTPRTFFNHEEWHHRHVVPYTNASSAGYVSMSAPTGSLATMSLVPFSANSSSPASLFSAISSAWVSTNSSSTTSLALSLASASATALQATSAASLYGPMEDLNMDKSADWDENTESACSTALIAFTALHGVATNPSGIAACYNVQSLDSVTGIFEVDLRLYRLSAPTDGWLKLDSSSVGVGLTYVSATISATRPKKAKREDQPLPWFPAERDEAADIYIRRSTGVPPRRLESMTFVGTVDVGRLAELKNTTKALSVLTPAITLSGTQQDGILINTRLSTQDASFVYGVFASTGSESSQPASTTGINELILQGTKLNGFPTGLIISSIWALLYLIMIGYGAVSRYQARESYRRRVKHRFSGDAITKRRMRWA